MKCRESITVDYGNPYEDLIQSLECKGCLFGHGPNNTKESLGIDYSSPKDALEKYRNTI